MTSDGPRGWLFATRDPEKLMLAVASGFAIGYVAMLAISYRLNIWVVDAHGHALVNDFAAFWAAGHLAQQGHAVQAYDPHLEHAAEASVVGHPFAATLGWSYPPLFLFVARLLAALPYAPAFLLWCATTLLLYASTVAAIAERRAAFLVACAAPWSLLALMPGQNGFLTAALVGAGLLLLERRSALAGICFGLLSYKPQFGILVPFALMAGGYARAFWSAAATVLVANGLAAALFGTATLVAFVDSLAGATGNHLIAAGLGWNKLHSAFGLARALGAGSEAAWIVQGATSIAVAAGITLAWRAQIPRLLKAALLAAAIPLATPYVFVYDLPILGIALAFLFRERSFDRTESAFLALSLPCLFGFLWLPVPTAFFASLLIAAIAVRRATGYVRHESAASDAALVTQ